MPRLRFPRFSPKRVVITLTLIAALSVGVPHCADAVPIFAHEYALVCQKCHSTIPALNAFGQAFLDHGYALPGVTPKRVFPIATKENFAYSSEPDRSGLPKAVVDEVELFIAGTLGSRANYFIEQYVVDGGRHGSLRDAWLQYRFTSDTAKVPLSLQAGSFTLPLPVDPESFRETSSHYAVFDQTLGNNPFTFFEPKIGLQARIGSNTHGTSLRILALSGHDKQSGIPALGTDVMVFAQQSLGPMTFSAYEYTGRRTDAATTDRFERHGFGISYASRRWSSETVVQTSRDTSIDGRGNAGSASGGFSQVRYEFNRRFFALVRYDGTNDPIDGFSRSLTPLLGFRVSHNSRFTLEDVITHVPQAKHVFNTQFTVAY